MRNLAQLELDYTYSPEHNFTYVVQWDRQRSIPPANVDDEELVGFGPVTSHPLSRHTVGWACLEFQNVLTGIMSLTGHDLFHQSTELYLPRSRLRRFGHRERWSSFRICGRVSSRLSILGWDFLSFGLLPELTKA